MGAIVKPTSRGQITLKKSILAHMGLEAGDRLEILALPGGKVQLQPVRSKKPMSSLLAMFEPRPAPPVSDEEIEAAIVQGAVDRYRRSLDSAPRKEDEAA